MKLPKMERGKKWSLRSQASFQREATLREQLFRVQRTISHDQRQLEEVRKDLGRRTEAAVLGNSQAAGLITPIQNRIRDVEGHIKAFEAQQDKLQAEISALAKLEPSQAKTRSDGQNALAKLAIERFEVDQKIGSALRSVRALLGERSEMTGRMLALTREIDFTLAFDGLDADRFQALEIHLPADLDAGSEAWVRWLLGERQETERYRVCDEILILPETLASPNVYRRGEEVDLTPEQLREISATLSSDDYPRRPLPKEMQSHSPRVEKCAEAAKQDA